MPTASPSTPLGDLFIADTYNNVIREVVKATGDIITVAGNGTYGYSGDSGPATTAELDNPFGVAVDAAGDLFIADTYNSVVRRTTPTATVNVEAASLVVTTLADTPTPGFTTLRQAIANAATLRGSPTITFAPGLTGTIDLGSGLVVGSDVNIDGPGASSLTVSGGGPSSNFSVFTVDSGVTAGISGLTITNGYAPDGGGLLDYGTATLTGCTVSGNSASFGGGIWSNGTLTVTGSTFTDNSADDGGGGIAGNSTTTVTDCTIASNSASYGGGIVSTGTMTVTDCTVANNLADGSGGGIENDSGTMTVIGSTVAANSAAVAGGGILNALGTMTVTDSTIAANSAQDDGGGIFNTESGTLTAVNCTIAYNRVASGSGSGGGLNVGNGTATLTNTIVAGNSGSGGDVYGSLAAASSNSFIGGNPLLAPLGNYGGLTQTMPPLPGSPILGAGSTASFQPASPPTSAARASRRAQRDGRHRRVRGPDQWHRSRLAKR